MCCSFREEGEFIVQLVSAAHNFFDVKMGFLELVKILVLFVIWIVFDATLNAEVAFPAQLPYFLAELLAFELHFVNG